MSKFRENVRLIVQQKCPLVSLRWYQMLTSWAQPNPDDCYRMTHAVEYDYIFALAKLLGELEQEEDDEGLGQIWSLYGTRDCIIALHILESHQDQISDDVP